MMHEYALLVRTTLQYLKQQNILLERSFFQHQDKPIQLAKTELPSKPVQPKKASTPAPKQNLVKEEKQTEEFGLVPMPAPSGLTHRFSKYVAPVKLHVPIVLILPEEIPPFRLFLENVSSAITRHVAPSKVILSSEKIEEDVKFVIAPLTSLKIPAKPHEFYQKDGMYFLPMKDFNDYLNDRNLKLSLWNQLKKIRSMHPFS